MQLLRFAVVGVLNTLIDFGVLNGLLWLDGYHLGWRLAVCNGLAFAAANGNSYLLNKRWTFGDAQPISVCQVGLFAGLTSIGMVINSLVIYLLTFSGWAPLSLPAVAWINVAKVAATFASMAWNFYSYRHWVFSAKSNALSARPAS